MKAPPAITTIILHVTYFVGGQLNVLYRHTRKKGGEGEQDVRLLKVSPTARSREARLPMLLVRVRVYL